MGPDVYRVAGFIPALAGKPLEISSLGGGLTNRNYRVRAGDDVYVLRIAGSGTELLGIDRGREVACQRAAAAAGVAPSVIAFHPEHGALLTAFCPGRTLAPEDFADAARVRRAGQVLRRCHDAPVPDDLGAFSPFATIRDYVRLACAKQVRVPAELAVCLDRLTAIEAELAGG